MRQSWAIAHVSAQLVSLCARRYDIHIKEKNPVPITDDIKKAEAEVEVNASFVYSGFVLIILEYMNSRINNKKIIGIPDTANDKDLIAKVVIRLSFKNS